MPFSVHKILFWYGKETVRRNMKCTSGVFVKIAYSLLKLYVSHSTIFKNVLILCIFMDNMIVESRRLECKRDLFDEEQKLVKIEVILDAHGNQKTFLWSKMDNAMYWNLKIAAHLLQSDLAEQIANKYNVIKDEVYHFSLELDLANCTGLVIQNKWYWKEAGFLSVWYHCYHFNEVAEVETVSLALMREGKVSLMASH